MSSFVSYPFELTRLHYQKGDFRSAQTFALAAATDAKAQKDYVTWLESLRLLFQASMELSELHAVNHIFAEVTTYLESKPGHKETARAEVLLSLWQFQHQKVDEAKDLIDSAIRHAVEANDLESLCRALLASAVYTFSESDFGKSIELLNKVEMLTKELSLVEIEISAQLLKSHIYREKKDLDRSVELLWESYEKAQAGGYHFLRTNIIALLTYSFHLMGRQDLVNAYSEVAFRGIDKKQYPRVHSLLEQVISQPSAASTPDLILDEATHGIRERVKGALDFKNQHILYDLAEMFIKNPGKRFSKEDIVDKIWRQIYDPRTHDNTVYVSIKRLRLLLEPDPDSPRYILRDRKGYYLPAQTGIKVITEKEQHP